MINEQLIGNFLQEVVSTSTFVESLWKLLTEIERSQAIASHSTSGLQDDAKASGQSEYIGHNGEYIHTDHQNCCIMACHPFA